MADWRSNLDMLPEHMRDGIVRYMELGIPPGSFAEAVLCNDLKNAFGRADMVNERYLKRWCEYVMWHLPSLAQGSPERVATWIGHAGLSGMNEYYAAKASQTVGAGEIEDAPVFDF